MRQGVKLIRIYLLLLKANFKVEFNSKLNFFMGFFVDIIYQFGYFAFFYTFYSNNLFNLGISKNELILLLGIDTVADELIVSIFLVYNFRNLSEKIRSFAIDSILTKPVSSQFLLSLGSPYVPALFSTFSGIGMIVFTFASGSIEFHFMRVFVAFIMFSQGFILVYSVLLIINCLSFFIPENTTVARISESIPFSFTGIYQKLYQGFEKIIFFYILPMVYVSSMSSMIISRGIQIRWVFISSGLVVLFWILSKKVWQIGLKRYISR